MKVIFVKFRLVGLWTNGSYLPGGIDGTGPIVLFNNDASLALVISAFNNFMAHNQFFDASSSTLSYGLVGSITSVPVGYTLETIVYADAGINTAMLSWGDALLGHYGKERNAYKRDYTLRYLGYRCVLALL